MKARSLLPLFLAAILSCGAAPPPSAQAAAAIRSALAAWMSAFNGREANAVCTLFAPDLRYDVGPFLDGTYDQLCDRLRRAVGNPQTNFRYALDIKEILIAGDLAVVRLVWTLTTTLAENATPVVTTEPGMDVMRRESDGTWRIVRFIAYTVEQNSSRP